MEVAFKSTGSYVFDRSVSSSMAVSTTLEPVIVALLKAE